MDQHHQHFSDEQSLELGDDGGHIQTEHHPSAAAQEQPMSDRVTSKANLPHSVLEMIEQVEQQLHRIREAQREQDENLAQLNARFQAVERAEADLEEQDRALNEQREALDQKQETLEEQRASLHAEREQWEQYRSTEDSRIAQQRSDIDEREQAIARRAEECERQVAEINERERHLHEQRDQFVRESEDLQQRLERAEKNAQDLTGRVESLQRELIERAGELETAASERDALRTQVNNIERERDALSSRIESFSQEKERLEQERASLAAQVEEHRQTLETLQRELAARDETTRSSEAEIAAARRHVEEVTQALQERDGRQTELERELASRDESIVSLRAEITGANRRVEEATQSLREKDERLTALEGDLASRDQRIDSLKAEITAAREQIEKSSHSLQEQNGQAERHAEVVARLEKREQHIKSLEATLANERAERERAEQDRDARLSELKGKIEQAEQSAASYESMMQDLRKKAKRIDAVAKHTQQRQSRLKRMRKLLRERHSTNQMATVDREKYAGQMRTLEAERVKIAAARYAMEHAERKMKNRWARQRSIVTVGWLALLLIANVAISWLAADAISPPERTAHLTIEPRTNSGATVEGERLEQWQQAQLDMLADEGFHRSLARRLSDRRVIEDASENSIRTMMTERISTDTNPDGSLTLTLAGYNRRALPATLDVIATTLTAESQRLASRRGDGAWASVRHDSGTGNRTTFATMNAWPSHDRRIIWAGPIFLLTMAASVAGILLVHRRLIQAKRTFDAEHSTFIDEALAKS